MTETNIHPAESASRALKVGFGGASIAGIKDVNEDAFSAYLLEGRETNLKGIAACIADGASCSDGAQLASQTSVTNFIEDYYSTPESWAVKESAARVLSSLNTWLFNTEHRDDNLNSSMTTFSAVVLKANVAHVFHVGDSRIYIYSDRRLRQLTRDHVHTVRGEQYLTRALGLDSHLEVDYSKHDIAEGDVLVLLTDGVHGYSHDDEIQEKLENRSTNLEVCAREIVDQSLDKGSTDNLSCLLVEVRAVPMHQIDEVHRQLTQLVIPPVMEPGMKMDDLEVVRVLHSGTRSHVYEVRDLKNGKAYAAKVPSLNFKDDPLYLEAFVREQWAGRRLNHPGVMKIFPGSSNSPFLYHICELVDGQTLREWMNDNPRPSLSVVRELVKGIVAALRGIQRMGMVHRDLKPENILVTAEGVTKIIDLGAVQIAGFDEIAYALEDSLPIGSVNYAAPEYIKNGVARSVSDLFSLGVIVYEMLCGDLPYRELSTAIEAAGNRRWEYRSLRLRREDIPVWLDLALEKAVNPTVENRQQVFSEFVHDLCNPNQSLVDRHESAPFLDRNPVLFWKLVSAMLFVSLIVLLLRVI
jgi:protein phosphatase